MKLSVAMITYNHERYVERAIQSVIEQKFSFDYEIVVGDDISTDRTRDILLEYYRKYPDKIRLLLHNEKKGVGGNLYSVLTHCVGAYIALLEGDDFWESPYKLQTLSDFLDANPDCASCFHATNVYSENLQQVINRLPPTPLSPSSDRSSPKYTLDDVLNDRIFPMTCSVVFRAKLYEIPQWFQQIVNVDTALLILNAHYGSLGYVDELFGTYRIHDGGIWSGSSKLNRVISQVQTFEMLSRHFKGKYDKYFGIQRRYLALARAYQTEGKIREAKRYFRKAFQMSWDKSLTARYTLTIFLSIYMPHFFWLFRASRRLLKRI